MQDTVTLRSITPADEAFLRTVYASTREEELAPVPWTNAEKDAFLRMQFTAQHTHYQQHYAGAAFDVILLGEIPVGRLYVSRWREEIRIIDIALIPPYRGRGIGGGLLRSLQQEGREVRKPLTIHVERANPALHLYERLGFRLREDKGVYLFLEWRPDTAEGKPA